MLTASFSQIFFRAAVVKSTTWKEGCGKRRPFCRAIKGECRNDRDRRLSARFFCVQSISVGLENPIPRRENTKERKLKTMKKNFIFIRTIAALTALFCLLSMALTFVSCSNEEEGKESGAATPITITLEVVGPDGSSKEHTVKTDSSKNLRQALEGAGLISGEEGAYGLYVKVVDGITADYDVDGSWWSLTKDGELCSGVDSTAIADGDHFEFTYSK